MADFLPRKDGSLLNWARTFADVIAQDPFPYSLDDADAAEMAKVLGPFEEAMAALENPASRSHSDIVRKDDTRHAMKRVIRRLVRRINSAADLSDGMRSAVGLRPIGDRRRIPALPENGPTVYINRRGDGPPTIRLVDGEAWRRGRPRGAIGAIVLYAIAEHEPANERAWRFGQTMSRTTATLNLPDVALFTMFWLKAAWLDSTLGVGTFGSAVRYQSLIQPGLPRQKAV